MVLKIPQMNRHFYVKTDFSAKAFSVVCMQADDSDKARSAEAQETAGGPCDFAQNEGGGSPTLAYHVHL